MMLLEILSFIIGAVGSLTGVIGLVVAYFQGRKAKSVERLRKEQLAASINRAKYLIIPNEIIETILGEDTPTSRETLRQWLWSLHKGASDNYVYTVSDYLLSEEKFTYDDLEHAKRAGVITNTGENNWEEHVWRSLIGLRPENRGNAATQTGFQLSRTNWRVNIPSAAKPTIEEKVPDNVGQQRAHPE